MRYVVDSQQMKSIDNYTIQEIGIPSLVLMERAALAVVEQIEKRVDKKDSILCLCGTGNNGGDGVAIARMLHQKGYTVQCRIVGNLEKCSKETGIQIEIAKKIGVPFWNKESKGEYTIIVDALFGIGLSRDITGEFAKLIEWVNQQKSQVFAVDIPSGVCADTGHIKGIAIKADMTITFGYWKTGLLLFPGCTYAGNVVVADIGFSDASNVSLKKFLFTKEDIKTFLPERKFYSNKGTYGKVLILAGSKNMAGACYLSASAAYHMGVGLVKVVTVEENRTIIQEKLPEAVLMTYETEQIEKYLDDIKREIQGAKAIVVGPGIGRDDAANLILEEVLQNAKVPTIVDADALQLLAKKKKYILPYEKQEGRICWSLPEHFILTPHLKEMAALLGNGMEVSEIKSSLLDIVLACKMNKNVLVLKDARTLVIQSENCYINTSGNNGMATAGSGDVLTGIIAGLLGQGVEPYLAAALGVYIHGFAGDIAAEKKGWYSLMAQDIIFALPELLSW